MRRLAVPTRKVATRLPGTTKLNRLEENIGAAEVELTAGELREIEGAASNITVPGERSPELLEQMSYR